MAANKIRREPASGMDAVDRPEAVRRRLLRNELRPERRYSVAWLLFAAPALHEASFPHAIKKRAGNKLPPARRG